MLRVLAALAALAVGASAVLAQNAQVIAQRKEAMKALGSAAKGPGSMAKGDAPFNAETVKASLQTVVDTAGKVKNLFPDDSQTGDTDALPVAFEKKADVMARFDKLSADAKAAAAVGDHLRPLRLERGFVRDCRGGCHKEYRKPK